MRTRDSIIAVGALCLLLGIGAAFVVPKFAGSATQTQSAGEGEIKASTASVSGLPIPRFVSLKADEVNVRRGPSQSHQVAWVFAKKGLPVEIVAEYENWRRIRDSDGEEGWVFQSLLSGVRTALVAPWRKSERIMLYDGPKDDGAPVAVIEAGVLGRVLTCSGEWCEFATSGFKGWLKQTQLWGVYPSENIE